MRSSLLLPGGALLGLLFLLTVVAGADTTHAGTFNPQIRFCFDDFTTPDFNPTLPGDPGECDGDNSAGTPSTFSLGFDVEKGDVNFAAIVSYIPSEWEITRGDEFPIGTKAGLTEAIATIGIINGPCDNTLELVGETAGFVLLNASLDSSDTITFDEEAGGPDEFREDWAEDLDGNTLIEAVDKFPDFIGRIIDDEEGNPQQPFRRSAGHLVIAGADVLLQYLVYEPGTFIDKRLPNDPDLGYPSVVLLQNAGDPDVVPEPGSITDFCTPLSSTTTSLGVGDACDSVVNDDADDDDLINDGCPALGTPESEAETSDGSDPCANNEDDDVIDDLEFSRGAGEGERSRVNDGCPQAGDSSEGDIEYVLNRNPSEEGSYTITSIAFGQPDADGDGYENSLDTCPLDPNVGDPRIKGDGDLDEDGLDAICDPNDDPLTGGLNSDQDGDGYVNRQDNCALVSNGEDTTNQDDEDLDEEGDRMIDLIGDDCDPEPDAFNGEPWEERMRTLEVDVEIGPGGPDQGSTDDDGGGEEDGGGGGGVIIVIAVVAAVVVLGGGGFYFMRRRGA